MRVLAHFSVSITTVRNCQADIIPNAKQMIEDYCVSKGIVMFPKLGPCAIIKISSHNWPGNYRELKSCIENAVICCNDGVIRGSDLKITRRDTSGSVPNDERGKLIYYLMRYSGKRILVREAMGISAPTLDKKLKLHGIDYKLYKRRRER